MSRAPEHSRWEDSTAAYLLDALDEDERAGFETHLHACGDCRGEVERLRVAVDALPSSPRQFAPPPELKSRIMAVVSAEAELLRAAGPRADRPVAARPRRSGWRSWRPGLALAGAAAAVALAAGIGSGALGGGDEASPTRTVVARVTVPDASARLLVRATENHSTLETRGLPHPAPGRIYQVWLKRRGHADPEPTDALFDVRRDGSASVDVPGSMRDVEAVLVTSEPDGGSQVPTRKPVLIASPT